MSAGKGDTRRPSDVRAAELAERWARTFGTANPDRTIDGRTMAERRASQLAEDIAYDRGDHLTLSPGDYLRQTFPGALGEAFARQEALRAAKLRAQLDAAYEQMRRESAIQQGAAIARALDAEIMGPRCACGTRTQRACMGADSTCPFRLAPP